MGDSTSVGFVEVEGEDGCVQGEEASWAGVDPRLSCSKLKIFPFACGFALDDLLRPFHDFLS